MLIHRWQGVHTPNKEQVEKLLLQEGLDPFEKQLDLSPIQNRLPFSEVTIIISGRAILKFGSKEVLMKEGDRILIPAGTVYTQAAQTPDCLCICAYKL